MSYNPFEQFEILLLKTVNIAGCDLSITNLAILALAISGFLIKLI
jgi:hypothetical protein